MRRIFGYAVLCLAIVSGLTACSGGGKSDSAQTTQVVGTWAGSNNLTVIFTNSLNYTLYESGTPTAWGVYSLSGNQISMSDRDQLHSCGTTTGVYQVNTANNILTFALVNDSCSTRPPVLNNSSWAKGSNVYPYYEIYGAQTGDTTISTTGHTYLGSSNTGSVFNVSGHGRFILYVPSTSTKVLFDAFGLGAQWPNSTGDPEYAHYVVNMNPTGSTWAQGGDTFIEGPPDGSSMENTVNADSYYGFSTYGTSTLTVYIVP